MGSIGPIRRVIEVLPVEDPRTVPEVEPESQPETIPAVPEKVPVG